MNLLTQIRAVTLLNLRAVPQRLGASLVTVIGVAAVVAVMISLLGIGAGVLKTAGSAADPRRVIVLSSGAAAEYLSALTKMQVDLIGQAAGVQHNAAGAPMAQPTALVVVELSRKSDGGASNVLFRGAGPALWAMNSNIHLITGRMYRPGLHELIVGRAARDQYKNMQIGDHLVIRGTDWTVVGAFEDNGGIDESSLLADADTVLAAFDRTAYQSVEVQLQSPASFNQFSDELAANPQLQVQVKRVGDYYKDQVKGLTTLLNFVGYFVGGIMALGVVFGALNTMYSAVEGRSREIATLKAIGFSSIAVVVSVLAESVLLAIPGAIFGSLIAWGFFNNQAIVMSGVSFPLAVTPGLLFLGLIWALIIGLIGGLAPSLRAVTRPVAAALRAS